jgi:hypothetical protein
MSAPSHESEKPLSAAQLQHWLLKINRQRGVRLPVLGSALAGNPTFQVEYVTDLRDASAAGRAR